MQMRASNELDRLSAAEPALLVDTEPVVDAREEERILEGILASSHPRVTRQGGMTRRRRTAYLLVGAAFAAAAVAVASIGHGHGNPSTSRPSIHHPAPLSGARIALAGYRFRTPAGFKKSASSCAPAPAAGKPTTVLNGFAAAASADDGCVEAAYLIVPSDLTGTVIPVAAKPVDVGTYQGDYVSTDSSGQSALYVELPKAGGSQNLAYLVLLARGLTEDELIAVAVSGLPAAPAS
jgi:hypothetical protein